MCRFLSFLRSSKKLLLNFNIILLLNVKHYEQPLIPMDCSVSRWEFSFLLACNANLAYTNTMCRYCTESANTQCVNRRSCHPSREEDIRWGGERSIQGVRCRPNEGNPWNHWGAFGKSFQPATFFWQCQFEWLKYYASNMHFCAEMAILFFMLYKSLPHDMVPVAWIKLLVF